jgi:type VI protein secretion system component Hcp
MRRGARSIVAGVAGACAAGLLWSVVAAPGAFAARGSGSLVLSPTHGGPQTVFTATFRMTGNGGPGACLGAQVGFTFDNQPVGSAPLDASCSASAQIQVPLGAAPGAHRVHAAVSGGASAGGTSTFTVDNGATTPSTTTATTAPTTTTTTSTSSAPPSWSNSTTPYPGWTAPPFASQPIPTSTGPCDTSGQHATAPDKGFLLIPAYSAGAHPKSAGSTLITEPASGALPITGLGPAGMVPPLLGDGRHPYQYLELVQPIDDNVSPKLRLAAAAGEPFGCLHVESFGGPGSGYGYLSYALKDALVISVQDSNPDGTPIQQALPTAAPATPAPASSPPANGKPAAGPPSTPAPPKAKFEKVVLGYTSLVWEYQEAAGAQAPIHRGSGTIQPPAPSPPLSYSNLVFAFGGLVAATVALMFAYHSRRRDLARRARRQRASHAS